MALRCWAHALPRSVTAARVMSNMLLSFHTDVCLLQDGESSTEGPHTAAQPGPSSKQPSQMQQQSRSSGDRQQQTPERLQRASGRGDDRPASSRNTGQRQAQGSAPQSRSPQAPDRQQQYERQRPNNLQQSQGDSRQGRPQQQQYRQQYQQQTQPRTPPSDRPYQQRDQRPPQRANFRPYDQPSSGQPGSLRFDQSSSPQQSFQRRPQAGPTGRQVPAQHRLDPEDADEQGNKSRRRKGLGKRITPTASQQEQPNYPPRMRGTASKAQGPPALIQDDEEAATRMQQDGELDVISDSYVGRNRSNVRGVPASWRDCIEDDEDKEDLEEARAISAFNRRRMTGEIKLPEDQMKEEIHALQMNLDPKLEFGLGAPRMSEAMPPNANELLEAAREPLTHMLDIQNEEEWQALTEGMAGSLEYTNHLVHERFMKPKVLEAGLEDYVAETVPTDHPMSPLILQSLQMLTHNPDWDYHKKCIYMKRLVKDLVL